MEKGVGLDLYEEFNSIDFNSNRLEQRFVRTMETLASQPDKSIWLCSENRAEAKAIYRLLANDKLEREEILHLSCGYYRWSGTGFIVTIIV